MKGLILKDIYGCCFQIICGFALMIMPMLMLIISGGGEMINDTDIDQMVNFMKIFKPMLYGMVNYISIVVCSSFYLNTLSFDEKSGWTKMQRAMPLSGWQIIGGKFLGAGSVVGILMLISLGFNILSAFVFDISPKAMIAMPICFALVEIVTLYPSIVFGYFFGAKAVTWVYLVIMVIMAAGIIIPAAMCFVDLKAAPLLKLAAFTVLPILTVIVVPACIITGKIAIELDT